MQIETFYDTVKIFERALNKKIMLNISRTAQTESVETAVNPMQKFIPTMYRMTVPYDGVGVSSSEIDSYALLHHGLAHIIFESTSKVLQFFDEDKNKKFKTVYNILEDDRIEDCLGKLYLGAYQDLQNLKPKACQQDPCEICRSGKERPVIEHILIGMRSGICKICSTPQERCIACKQAREMVLGGKSIKATFVAMKHLEKYIKDEDGPQQGETGTQIEDPNGSPVQTPVVLPFSDFKFDPKDNLDIDSPSIKDLDKISTDQLLKEAITEFLEQLSEVQQALDQTQKKEKIFGKVVDNKAKFVPERYEYRPDTRIRQLRKYFKDLKFKETQRGVEEGGELLDMDSLILHKVDKTGEVFQSTENTHGLEVIYLVDISGSMKGGGSLRVAKQALTDMVELSKGLFDIKIFAFSGHRSQPTISLVQQIQPNKISSLDVNNEYCFTHTHHGVQIASQKFNGGSSKKLLMILTDGMPCSCKYDDKIMDGFAKKAIENARKRGVRVYTIISGESSNKERIANIFGKASTISNIENPEDIYRIMKEHTVKNLLRTIQGG